MDEIEFEKLRSKNLTELRKMLKETTDIDEKEDIEAAIFLKRMKKRF